MRKARQGTFDGPFIRVAKWLLERGVHPNHLTFAQIPVFAVEVWAAQNGHAWIFISSILLVIALDGGDGILARTGNLQSRKGAILDSTFDTVGIAIIMWGAAQFFPEAESWFLWLFVGNAVVYLQNALLDEKMVTYLRGPTLIAIAWPNFLPGALLASSFVVIWICGMRLPRTFRALGELD
ncbi:MAG: CDP-alcohol phosphatidyltransferase family protein [Thermoplasmatota archaeon]